MARFSRGKRALMISMRSGAAFPYREMVQEWTGAWVHNSEFEPKQPQLTPQPVGADPQALQHANPARTEFATVDFLSNDPFSNLNVGFDAYILVHQRGNQLVNGDYVRFRDVKTGIGTTINLTLTGWVDNLSTSYPAPGFVVIEKVNATTGRFENEVISFTGVTGNSTAGSLTGCVRGTASPFRGVTPRATVASAHAAGTKVFGSRPITLIPTTFVDAANTTITETNSFQALVVAGINWGSADGTLVGGGFQCTYGPLNDRS
jgi:hypothetical protein